jgi:hypothetical protein
MTIDPDVVRAWCSELCRQATIEPTEVGRLLRMPGTAVERGRDYLVLEPAPAGTKRVMIGRHDGALLYVTLELADRTMTRTDLERRFGLGHAIPRLDVGRAHRLRFCVELAGAPYSCALFASFAEPPVAASLATAVMLRRDPVRLASTQLDGRFADGVRAR